MGNIICDYYLASGKSRRSKHYFLGYDFAEHGSGVIEGQYTKWKFTGRHLKLSEDALLAVKAYRHRGTAAVTFLFKHIVVEYYCVQLRHSKSLCRLLQ